MRAKYEHWFRQLAEEWPNSAAAQTGIVVRIDREAVHQRDVYNTHLDFFALYLVRQGRGIHIIDGVSHGMVMSNFLKCIQGLPSLSR